MTAYFSRRGVLQLTVGFVALSILTPAFADAVKIDGKHLKPGEWEWYPERAESGPVAVIVSLSDQLAYAYRNGIRIGVSTVSTGKKGFETPTGVFSVLRKERMHHSHKYHNAAMPDSQFFYGGAALHAGGLPGYPSSHGCVHLPRPFADKLFAVTHNGTPIIVTQEHFGIGSLSHAGLVMTNHDLVQIEKMTGNVKSKTLPFDAKGESKSAFSVVVSSADRSLTGFINGDIAFQGNISFSGDGPLGEHVYILKGADKKSSHLHWVAVGLGEHHKASLNEHAEFQTTSRLQVGQDLQAQISANLHPGSTFVVTDLPAHPSTRTGTDFVIMRVG